MPNPQQVTTMVVHDPNPTTSPLRPHKLREGRLPVLVPIMLIVLIIFLSFAFLAWLSLQLKNWTKTDRKGMTRWRERKEVDMERVGILRESGSTEAMRLGYGSGNSSPKKSVRFSESLLVVVDAGERDRERQERMRLLRAEEIEEQIVFQQQTEMFEESFGADERERAAEAEAEARFLSELEVRRNISTERENEGDVGAEFQTRRVSSGESALRLVDSNDDAPAEGEYLAEGRVYFKEDGMRHIQE